jgi:hypothetical protein
MTKPAFRKPWENGARGYAEADTFAAAIEGYKRVRTVKMFHMTNSGEAGNQKCITCNRKLSDPAHGTFKRDEFSTWEYHPKFKKVGNGQHYICSWTTLFNEIFRQADEGILR